MRVYFWLSILILVLAQPPAAVVAATPVASLDTPQSRGSSKKLEDIRSEVLLLQKNLLDGFQSQASAHSQIQKINKLRSLQQREKKLGLERMQELEKTVADLEQRKAELLKRAESRKRVVRNYLKTLISEPLYIRSPLVLDKESEHEVVNRKILASLSRAGLRELEELRVDLSDSENLEKRIQEEKQQLSYLFQEIEEKESLLALNQQLQMDLLKKEHQVRVAQLEQYRRLKSAESQVEKMLQDFNARRELEAVVRSDQEHLKAVRSSEGSLFSNLRGKLALPLLGRVISSFGRFLDPKSQLYVFKKGVDIQAPGASKVRAVAAGKVAFAGSLPNYGNVLILDHGEHYYTLCGNLGELSRRVGESVQSGEVLGTSAIEGSPVYFEIRSRNIAVNPLQWLSSSFSLNP